MSKSNWRASIFLNKKSSRPVQIAVIGTCVFIIIFLIFSYFVKLEQTIVADGEIIPLDGEKIIFNNVEGFVEKEKLNVGDKVSTHQRIARIKYQNESSENVQKTLHEINDIYTQFSKNKDYTDWNLSENKDSYVAKMISQLSLELEKYKSETRNFDILLRNKKAEISKKIEKLEAKLKKINKNDEKKYLGSLIDELESELDKYKNELSLLENSTDKDKHLLYVKFSNFIKEHYIDIYKFYTDHNVLSPVEGTIAKYFINDNDYLKRGEKIVSIVTDPSKLGVHINIPTYKIGEFSKQSKIKISVDAYPSIIYDYFGASILSIDQIISKDEIFFSILANIYASEDQKLDPESSSLKLVPGMRVKAHIQTKEETLMNIILNKLFNIYRNSRSSS